MFLCGFLTPTLVSLLPCTAKYWPNKWNKNQTIKSFDKNFSWKPDFKMFSKINVCSWKLSLGSTILQNSIILQKKSLRIAGFRARQFNTICQSDNLTLWLTLAWSTWRTWRYSKFGHSRVGLEMCWNVLNVNRDTELIYWARILMNTKRVQKCWMYRNVLKCAECAEMC